MKEAPIPRLRWPLRPSMRGLKLVYPVIVGVLVFTVLTIALFRWAENHSSDETVRRAQEEARTQASLLTSELQKFQLLPLVLPEYPEVRQALSQPSPAAIDTVNSKLELLADRTDAAVIYLLDERGRTIAASNHRRADSFVGQNYGFRPYFSGAMRRGAAQTFALGTVSGRPGLYIARRIDESGRAIGVIVVKVEFDAIERDWRTLDSPLMVTNRDGIVLVTSVPEWRFAMTRPLTPEKQAAALASKQFGETPLRRLRLETRGQSVLIDGDAYRGGSAEVPLLDATITSFQPRAPDKAADLGTARTASLLILLGIAGALVMLVRAREHRLIEENARIHLEHQVERRTVELTEANRLLTRESAERARADERYRSSREELAQANRLGSLGQITAGVAHEINQPVAAIRTFAENAQTFLTRGEPDKARGNLATIVAMTERIGAITTELRRFARRRAPAAGPVHLAEVMEGTLMLVGDQLRSGKVNVELPDIPADLVVTADRVRLEQILVNLIQNSVQATAGHSMPRIAIDCRVDGDKVFVRVHDNGPGVDPSVADELFTPFVTGREEGLGLGLGIAREIAREFGGDLVHEPSADGACFVVELRRP